jgi:hypothetical protein
MTNHENIWIVERTQILTRPRQRISSPKRILTISWSPLGCSLMQIHLQGSNFDAGYFCSEILQEMDRICPARTDEDTRREVVLHFDNATPRRGCNSRVFGVTSNENGIPFALCTGSRPFWLLPFEQFKTTLMGEKFGDEREFLHRAMRMLDLTSRDVL